MLKHLSIFAVVLAFGTSSLSAQPDVVLHKFAVPGADFDIIVSTTRPAGGPASPHGQSGDWKVYPIGAELAHAMEQEVKQMFLDVGSSQLPIHAFQVEHNDGKNAAAVYIVPKGASFAAKE